MKTVSNEDHKERREEQEDDNHCEQQQQQQHQAAETTTTTVAPPPLHHSFPYHKGSCALEYWEPIALLGEGSISDIHLVRRRSKRIPVRYKKKRDIMKFAKKATQATTQATTSSDSQEQTLFVLKSIMKDHVDNDMVLEEMRREIYTMSKLRHSNICQLYEAYERRRHIYLVMEYCNGGDLQDLPSLTEPQCATIVSKVLSAVAYMHQHGVVHRDLKLENIMMDHSKNGQIKIIDFGLATKFLSAEHKVMTDKVGTLYTMAPQVLQGVYTSQCDLWSIGVITYMLLSNGVNPFWGPSKPMSWRVRRRVMMDRILRCAYQPMTGPPWQGISNAAKDFCKALLQMDPDARPTAQEALDSEWIRCAKSHPLLSSMEESIASQQEQQSRTELAQLLRDATELLLNTLTDRQVLHFHNELERFDTSGNGKIQVRDFETVLRQHTAIDHARLDDLFDFSLKNQKDVVGQKMFAYNDFWIQLLTDRDRAMTEKVAEALDRLDTNGQRRVEKEQLVAALEGIIVSPTMLESILRQVELFVEEEDDNDGTVSTTHVLEMLNKYLANDTRSSLRNTGSEHDQQTLAEIQEEDLVEPKSAVIPGGRTENGVQPKYVYEASDKSMREVYVEL